MIYPAHIRQDVTDEACSETTQTLEEHCRGAANYSRRALADAGLGECGYLLGLMHDMGKATAGFRRYLVDAAHGKDVVRGSVNHTFAAVRYLLIHFHDAKGSDQSLLAELFSYAVGAHHGAFDCAGEDGKNGFDHRLQTADIDYEEAINNFCRCCAGEDELQKHFQAAEREIIPLLDRLDALTQRSDETFFYWGLLARLLNSAVIDGDRRDTAAFMNGAVFPTFPERDARSAFWRPYRLAVEAKLEAFPCLSDIDRARRSISDCCRRAAAYPPGIYRLHVPTGGGKTLSSLRYALAHAEAFGKRRLIFTAPLLSILDQNAKVIREYLNNDALILEHHSNLVQTDAGTDALDRNELLIETWDAPVIITTLVQLLNTLFAGKTACVRRFQALIDSVIVIDEVQTVPAKLLSLFSLAMNFLCNVCGATVVLCSATQPADQYTVHPLKAPIGEIVPYDAALWRAFRRTVIRDLGSMSIDGIIAEAQRMLEDKNSLLIVCNKKDEAAQLYRTLALSDAHVFHLSAGMCVCHRRDTLDAIRRSLAAGGKTICVSTQIIEAGVDISFAGVIRLSAGMDSVVQAAGRCNRNGEAGAGVLADVSLINYSGETLRALPDIQAGKDATLALLSEFHRDPKPFCGALDTPEAIRDYYHILYSRTAVGHMDGKIPGKPYSLYSLLSDNCQLVSDTNPYTLRQAFKTAGDRFSVFESDTVDVITAYGGGADLIANLAGARAIQDPEYAAAQLHLASAYSVGLYGYQVERLMREGALTKLPCGAWALMDHYDPETGFSITAQTGTFQEV